MNQNLESIRRRAWVERTQRPEEAKRLASDLGIGAVAARILAARGMIDIGEAHAFLNAGLASMGDPLLLPDMDSAVARIRQAIEREEPICIHGDYDVDGTTGTALLLRALRWLGVDHVTYEIPHRIDEGYGITPEAVDKLAEAGIRLIVTVDNGSTARSALERAVERGIDVVVTDHHQIDEELPPALALVNPWRGESRYPFRDLCGCALAFKLAKALLKALDVPPERAKPFLVSLLDLVAVATVADVMPLSGENRAVVRFGIGHMPETQIVGLRSLLRVARVDRVTADAFGWVLGPRLNAAGRTRHAGAAVELLTTDDENMALRLAKELDGLNRERREIEAGLLDEALEELQAHAEDPVILLARRGWHRGVMGIVASRILDRTEKPVILMAIEDGEAHGSARSLPGFNIHAALEQCRQHLIQFGGHHMAAGMSCRTDDISAFRAALIEHAVSLPPEALAPRAHTVDTDLSVEDLTLALLDDLAALEPHGEGNPKPLFILRGLRLADTPRVVGERHLKLRLADSAGRSVTALAWGKAERVAELIPGPETVDVIGQPRLNEWNGRQEIELTLKDWRPTEG